MTQNRRLAAIVFTDIVGFTSLMGNDEFQAFEILKQNRKLHNKFISKFGGQLIKEIGDGNLCTFQTISNSINFALEIQSECNNVPNLKLKIGIHQAEVVFERGDVFGDGVNIAARIEAITPAGSIYISETVFRNIENKFSDTSFIGEKSFKNVKHPIKIYQIGLGKKNLSIDDNIKMFNRLTKEDGFIKDNSIAVLPFQNLSNDIEQDYFCDGLAEELLNTLAKLGRIKVAARTSSFHFKGQNVDISEIGRKLRVNNIIEGSIRKSGNKIRITVQLINVVTGFQVWSNRYDRELADIFDIQDNISLAITEALKLKLIGKEKSALVKHGTDNPEAYELYLKALQNFHKFIPESLNKAIFLYKKAIELYPTYAEAYAGLVPCFHISWMFNYLPPEESIPEMQDAAKKSLELDDRLSESQMAMGKVKLWYEFDFVEAEKRFRKSLEFNPNNPDTFGQLGLLLAICGETESAIKCGAKALELDPFSPLANVDFGWIQFLCGDDGYYNQTNEMIEMFPNFWASHHMLGFHYWKLSDYDNAIKSLEVALKLNYSPVHISTLGFLYSVNGNQSKAELMLTKLGELNKEISVASFNFFVIYAGLGKYEMAFEYLSKAAVDRAGHLAFLNTYRKYLLPKEMDNPQLEQIMLNLNIPYFH